ncbi:hypothetical protein [Moorena sp. SIO3A2]|uniref:hypothetical protein n=1 Tax=Moorena sp. SIO3A2 TaxID=2607841 RepID=UPI0013B79F75|nr:hypothetical protein [Moorena sp. SIO3A2]NER90363.1 hypothetical protein [Moorena sp. SIO3A2]
MPNKITPKKRTYRTASKDFLNALAVLGRDSDAAKVAGVSETSIYKWRKEHPAFERGYFEAKNEFARSLLGGDLNNSALAVAAKILKKGKTITTTRCGTKTITERFDKNNELIFREVTTTDPIETIRHYEAPESLVKMLLPIEDIAIEFLESRGLKVYDPRMVTESKPKGLSPETINLMKTQMFGLGESQN